MAFGCHTSMVTTGMPAASKTAIELSAASLRQFPNTTASGSVSATVSAHASAFSGSNSLSQMAPTCTPEAAAVLRMESSMYWENSNAAQPDTQAIS